MLLVAEVKIKRKYIIVNSIIWISLAHLLIVKVAAQMNKINKCRIIYKDI